MATAAITAVTPTDHFHWGPGTGSAWPPIEQMKQEMTGASETTMNEVSDLLIVGTMSDPHISKTFENLKKYDINIAVLDYNCSTEITIHQYDHNLYISIDSKTITKNTTIWARPKLYYGSPFYFRKYERKDKTYELLRRQDDWREKEWRAASRILFLLNEEQLLTHPTRSAIMYKPIQQKIAKELGLNIVETTITNDLQTARNFSERHGRCIAKSVSGAKVLPHPDEYPEAYGVMTVEITKDDLRRQVPDKFAQCPHMLQPLIEKDCELRIINIEGVVFAFRIDSQRFQHTSLDWRHGDPNIQFKLCDIPKEIEDKINAFMNRFGLFSGSFDFIVSKGEYLFLECNKEGAWAWLDEIIDGKISETFADRIYKRVSRKKAI